jgi:hypothetical protein
LKKKEAAPDQLEQPAAGCHAMEQPRLNVGGTEGVRGAGQRIRAATVLPLQYCRYSTITRTQAPPLPAPQAPLTAGVALAASGCAAASSASWLTRARMSRALEATSRSSGSAAMRATFSTPGSSLWVWWAGGLCVERGRRGVVVRAVWDTQAGVVQRPQRDQPELSPSSVGSKTSGPVLHNEAGSDDLGVNRRGGQLWLVSLWCHRGCPTLKTSLKQTSLFKPTQPNSLWQEVARVHGAVD